jgi:hypothetical protein
MALYPVLFGSAAAPRVDIVPCRFLMFVLTRVVMDIHALRTAVPVVAGPASVVKSMCNVGGPHTIIVTYVIRVRQCYLAEHSVD